MSMLHYVPTIVVAVVFATLLAVARVAGAMTGLAQFLFFIFVAVAAIALLMRASRT
jgi:uncharacterized membrane protein YtjA (UPF0391 family)